MPWPWIILFAALWCAVMYGILIVAGVSRRLSSLESASSNNGRSTAEQLDVIAAGPRLGSTLPEFPGHPELDASRIGDQGRVILFISSSCGPCLRLAEALKSSDAAARPELTDMDLVVVTDEAGRDLFQGFASGGVVVQQAGEVASLLGIKATPFALGVDRTGVVAVGLPGSADDIANLAAKCSGARRQLQPSPA